MTKLRRVLVSLPHDIESEVNKIKASSGYERVSMSKIICALVREGLDAKNGHEHEKRGDTDSGL